MVVGVGERVGGGGEGGEECEEGEKEEKIEWGAHLVNEVLARGLVVVE